jgi:hypothetical protein
MNHQDAFVRFPSEDASELDLLLFKQSGVITWAQASALLSPGKVRHLVATGWRRLCRGVFVTAEGQLEPGHQMWAAVLAAGPGAVLAGLAAARAGGLRRVPRQQRDGIDVLVPISRRAANLLGRMPAEFPAVFVKRTRYLPRQDLQRSRPNRTTMERALVDAAQWAITDHEAQGVLAAGCQQRLVLPADLLAVVDRMPNLSRRRLIRSTAHDLAGGPEALSEIDLARLCRRFGVPAPEHQRRRRDACGRVRYLDAYWPDWHLHVEIDGAHHLEVGHWEADMRRQNDIWIAGDRILRFSAFQARHRPGEVAEQIRQALLAAGWR